MRLVGAVSNDDLVSLEDTEEVDDSSSSVVTPSENETLNRRVVFAQSFEILKLRQQLVKVQSKYAADVRRFENRIRNQRKRVSALRARVVGKSGSHLESEDTTMRALEEQIKMLKIDLASSKRKVMTYRAAFTYVNIPGVSVSKMMEIVEKDFEKRARMQHTIVDDDEMESHEDREPVSADYALSLLSDITTTSSKSSKKLAKEIRRIVRVMFECKYVLML